MATSLPIRGLFRLPPPAGGSSTTTTSSPCPARAAASISQLLLLLRPRQIHPHSALTTVQTHAFSTSSATQASDSSSSSNRNSPMFNWLKVKRIKKSYRAKGHVLKTQAKGKKPAPGDRKAFRKRIVLSNNSALAVPNLPELAPDTMLKKPTRRMTGAEAVAGGFHGADKTNNAAAASAAPPPQATAEGGQEEGISAQVQDVWADDEVRDVIDIARGMVSLPGPLVDKLRLLEAFKSSQSWGLFRKPHFLVRDETVDLVGRMQRAVQEKKALRMVIEGKAATGKSMLLLQAISHAVMNNWVVIHLPEAQELVNGNTEYAPIPNTSPMQFAQPVYVLRLLERIHDANESLLRSLRISQEYRTELLHVPHNSSLADLALAAREAESAWPLFLRFWRELTAVPGRPPVLLSTDGFAHWCRDSVYRDPKFSVVHAHEMALPRLFLSALSPTGYGAPAPLPFANGGAVLTTVGGNNSPHVVALDLAIRQSIASAAALVDDAVEIPQRDPYERRYDERVLDSLRGVEVLSVGGVSRDEARAVVEYWAASGLLRAKVTEKVVAEKWTLGGSGVLGEMERASLVNMRIGWT